MGSVIKHRNADGKLRFGLMWFNSQTPYLTSAVTSAANPPVLDVQTQVTLAQAAEEAGFDFLFMADGYVGHGEANARIGHGEPRLSSPVWGTLLMTATKHIGVATTLHTRYLPPAVIARLGANLDAISGGRWAWNIVPGTKDDSLIGMPPLEHGDRYAHASEAVRAVKEIWRSKGKPINFDGAFYRLEGQMMGPYPLQEPWPLLFNAGVSASGQELVAQECDYGFFTVVDDLEKVRGPVQNLARLAENAGRNPLEVNLVGSISIVVGASRKEADDKYEQLLAGLDMDAARGWASSFLGRSQTYQNTHGEDIDKAARSIGVASGARVLRGTPSDIAEQILEIYRSTGLRGYQVLPLTWSEKELLQFGEVFQELETAGVWTPPHKRGWSW